EDGHLDLVVVHSPNVVMLFGDGTGSFGAPPPTSVPGTLGVVVGHFSPDHHLDILIGSDGSSNVVLYTGDGQGGFANRVVIATAYPAQIAATGDLNGDGRTDVLLSELVFPGPRRL